MTYDYDLFVIGAGSGGVRAARLTAQLGKKVGIAEQSRVGGTCVIRGCVPKKFMVYGSEFGRAIEDAKGYGWRAENVQFNWADLRDNIAAEVDRLNGIYKNILSRNEVELFETRAVLKDEHTVHLVAENRDVTAEKILIAVGGEPMRDDPVDPDRLAVVSDDLFSLPELPKRLVVAGGGYIAVEFAHIFAGLGTEVTLVYRGQDVLKNFDGDIKSRVKENLKNHGIQYINNTVFAAIKGDEKVKKIQLLTGDILEAEQVLWAIGRKPLTDGLGLARIGVELDKSGAVIVDDDYKTAVPSVFAIGDVTNRVNLTPVAIREGAAFVSTQFEGKPKRFDYHNIPKAVFAQPPVGSVGLTEEECQEKGRPIDIYEADFRAMKNVLARSDERMYMKLIVDQQTNQVIGCHMVGAEAAELMQIVAIAVKAGVTKAQFDETCALHPTVSEEIVTMTTKKETSS